MITYQSKVPAALDGLVALWTAGFAAIPDAKVLVKDGPFMSAESGTGDYSLLSVGWSGFGRGYESPLRSMNEELGAADVMVETTWEGLGPSCREKFHIACGVVCRRGSGVEQSARTAAYQVLSQAGSMIGPPWIGGAVMKAVMSATSTLSQIQDRRGAIAMLGFTIECEAFSA